MRKRIYEIIETSHAHDRASAWYDGVMVILIVLSMVPLGFKEDYPVLTVIDKSCAVIFLLDYFLRWASDRQSAGQAGQGTPQSPSPARACPSSSSANRIVRRRARSGEYRR